MTTILGKPALGDWLGSIKLKDDQLRIMLEAAREHVEQPTDISPLRLQTIEDSDALYDRLATLELSEQSLQPGRRMARIKDQIKDTWRQIELAAIRDELAASRPDGCWCLGAGGRSPRYISDPTGQYDNDAHAAIVNAVQTLQEHCDCPEGKARKARDEAVKAAARAEYRKRKTGRILKTSGLPPHYRAYQWRDHPDKRSARRLAEWLDMATDYPFALICGPTGRGKTSLAAGIGYELADRGEDVIFQPVPDFLQLLKSGFPPDADPTETQILDALKNAGTLILDDLGAEKPSDYAGDRLYQLINHRHNHMMRTLFTSNLLPVGDPKAAHPELRTGLVDHLGDRMFGRINRMAGRPIIMSGPDLRG